MELNPTEGVYDVQEVFNETGYLGPECHRLVWQLKELHEQNLRKIDHELGTEGIEVRIGIT
jgi:hypothetical protein